jgi:hypothetical protein
MGRPGPLNTPHRGRMWTSGGVLDGSSKRQQPHCPQVSAIIHHQRFDLPQ